MSKKLEPSQELYSALEQIRILQTRIRFLERGEKLEIEPAVSRKETDKSETRIIELIRLLMIPIVLNLANYFYRLGTRLKVLTKRL